MNSKELKNIWEAYNQVYEQIGVPIPAGKTAKDVLEPLTKPHGGGKVVEPKKTLQQAHYEPEGEQLSENPLASLDKLGRSAAQTVGGTIGGIQGQKTGIPGGKIVGGMLGSQKGGQMYDRATQPLRGRVPGFNKGGTIKKEEVEIAAQYFYEMGLNEEGVDILIEDLGVEEFANFVYDIAEEYVLTEARAGGVKIEPKLASGKAIQGKPKAASLKRLRAQKEARRESEEKSSTSKPSGMKASLQRQSAVAAAAKKQPKKPGLLDRVAGAVNRGIEAAQNRAAADVEKRKKFMSAARETGKVIGKAARGAGQVAKGVASGVSGTAKLAGHVARKGLSDEYLMGYLIDEGYADNSSSAFIIVANMSEDWRESIAEEILSENAFEEEYKSSNKGRIARQTEKAYKTERRALDKGDAEEAMRQNRRRNAMNNPAGRRNELAAKNKPTTQNAHFEPEMDLFDYLLEYLVSEGYADTNKAALAIMTNMSEEWRGEIIESRVKELGDRLKDLQQRSSTTDKKAKRTAKLARDRFNDLSDKEKEFRKGVEDFARATKD